MCDSKQAYHPGLCAGVFLRLQRAIRVYLSSVCGVLATGSFPVAQITRSMSPVARVVTN